MKQNNTLLDRKVFGAVILIQLLSFWTLSIFLFLLIFIYISCLVLVLVSGDRDYLYRLGLSE
jgi:hypothetical protein